MRKFPYIVPCSRTSFRTPILLHLPLTPHVRTAMCGTPCLEGMCRNCARKQYAGFLTLPNDPSLPKTDEETRSNLPSKYPHNVDNEYDWETDFARSIEECYRVIRERKSNGGPDWTPKPPDDPSNGTAEISITMR